MSPGPARSGEVLPWRRGSGPALAAVTLVGIAAFTWPFFVDSTVALQRGRDLPWLFPVLVALLCPVLLAQLTREGTDAKQVAVLGVLAAFGGALRVLSAGTAGVEPMFFLVVVGGRVLGRAGGFLLGSLAVLTGAFLTGGLGPWLPFQMLACGWVGLGAALLPRTGPGTERWLLAGYGALAGLAYGAVMNLWFWPFLGSGAPDGAGFEAGAPAGEQLARYAVFYGLTSLGYDLPRALCTAVLVILAGPSVLAVLRRAMRRARFADEPATSGPRVPRTGDDQRLQ